MAEATGNVAQVTDEETKKATKSRKKAPKTKATKAKPEPEKKAAPEKEAAAPEPEAAPAPEPTTNGASKIDELETVTKAEGSTTEKTLPVTAPEPATEREINERIEKERREQTQKMFGGQVEEAALEGQPRFIEASIFPDAYCPLCGQKLSGNSKTGFKQAFYVHPFTPSVSLGKPCELKGKKLRAPTARMEIVD